VSDLDCRADYDAFVAGAGPGDQARTAAPASRSRSASS
jgi:hypothetical protein